MELTFKETQYEEKYGKHSLRVLKIIYDEAKEKGYCDLTDNQIIEKTCLPKLKSWRLLSIYRNLEDDNLIKRETSELIEKPFAHRKRKIFVNELPEDLLQIFVMRSEPLHDFAKHLLSHKDMALAVGMSTMWLHLKRYEGKVKAALMKKNPNNHQNTYYYHTDQINEIKKLIRQPRNTEFGTYQELQESIIPDKNEVKVTKLEKEIVALKEQMKQNQLSLSLRLTIMETLMEKNIKVDMQIVEYLVGSILDWHNNIVYRKENK